MYLSGDQAILIHPYCVQKKIMVGNLHNSESILVKLPCLKGWFSILSIFFSNYRLQLLTDVTSLQGIQHLPVSISFSLAQSFSHKHIYTNQPSKMVLITISILK